MDLKWTSSHPGPQIRVQSSQSKENYHVLAWFQRLGLSEGSEEMKKRQTRRETDTQTNLGSGDLAADGESTASARLSVFMS